MTIVSRDIVVIKGNVIFNRLLSSFLSLTRYSCLIDLSQYTQQATDAIPGDVYSIFIKYIDHYMVHS